ncbi:MAG: transposase [Saprospiraceae bacterium]
MKIYKDIYFTTATILNWYPLLQQDECKDVIIDSLRHCVTHQKAFVLAFVVMDTHFHVVWHIRSSYSLREVQFNFLKYTAQKLRKLMLDSNDYVPINYLRVNKKDRMFQIWNRGTLSIEIYNERMLNQKINYIHRNMSKKGGNDILYKYSSAYYFETGIRNWDFLA